MTAVSTRDALAKAIRDELKARTIPPDPAIPGSRGLGLTEHDLADALFTSGAVVDVATLTPGWDLVDLRRYAAQLSCSHYPTAARVFTALADLMGRAR